MFRQSHLLNRTRRHKLTANSLITNSSAFPPIFCRTFEPWLQKFLVDASTETGVHNSTHWLTVVFSVTVNHARKRGKVEHVETLEIKYSHLIHELLLFFLPDFWPGTRAKLPTSFIYSKAEFFMLMMNLEVLSD